MVISSTNIGFCKRQLRLHGAISGSRGGARCSVGESNHLAIPKYTCLTYNGRKSNLYIDNGLEHRGALRLIFTKELYCQNNDKLTEDEAKRRKCCLDDFKTYFRNEFEEFNALNIVLNDEEWTHYIAKYRNKSELKIYIVSKGGYKIYIAIDSTKINHLIVAPEVELRSDIRWQGNSYVGRGSKIGNKVILGVNNIIAPFTNISAGACLGNCVIVGHHSKIYTRVRVEYDCILGSNSEVKRRSKLIHGSNVELDSASERTDENDQNPKVSMMISTCESKNQTHEKVSFNACVNKENGCEASNSNLHLGSRHNNSVSTADFPKIDIPELQAKTNYDKKDFY